jgi:hypothetical protein
MFSTSMKIINATTRKYDTTILSKDCMSLILQVKYTCTFMYHVLLFYIYITPLSNLPLSARKPQRFTHIYNAGGKNTIP